MADLREVIIGNIRFTIMAGPDPDDRQVSVMGNATIFDQNLNQTRVYVGDLTSKMTNADYQMCQGLVDRFIQGVMLEYNITAANIAEGGDILDAQGQPQSTPQGQAAPQSFMPMEGVAPMTTSAPAPPPSNPGGGAIGVPSTPEPSAPVSTDTGDGEFIPQMP